MIIMGRRGGDHQRVAHDDDHNSRHYYSSIAMLQERFRQLERAKEIRQERELLKMKPSVSSSSSSLSYFEDHYGPHTPPPPPNNRVRHTVNAELLLFPAAETAKPSSRLSLSLWPEADSPVGGFRPGGPSHLAHTTVHSDWVMSIIKHDHHDDDDDDVDTSLHL